MHAQSRIIGLPKYRSLRSEADPVVLAGRCKHGRYDVVISELIKNSFNCNLVTASGGSTNFHLFGVEFITGSILI